MINNNNQFVYDFSAAFRLNFALYNYFYGKKIIKQEGKKTQVYNEADDTTDA